MLINKRKLNFIFSTLIFSCLLVPAYGYQFKASYAAIVFLLLYTCHNFALYRFILGALAVPAAFYAPIGYTEGPPVLNIFLALEQTYRTEAIEYLSTMALEAWALAIAVMASAMVSSINKQIPKRSIQTLRGCFVLSACLVFMTPFTTMVKNLFTYPGESVTLPFPPYQFWRELTFSLYTTYNDRLFFAEQTAKLTTWAPTKVSPDAQTLVVVIGESARPDLMSAYGFKFNTTPWMKYHPGVLYTNYVATGATTLPSLTHTLYQVTEKGVQYHNSIVRLFQAAKWHTVWISNQGAYGDVESRAALLGRQADQSFFMKIGDKKGREIQDSRMLPLFRQALNQNGRKVIFVHLIGSDPAACERTFGNQFSFWRNDEMSCYLESIKLTDSLIAEMANTVKNRIANWNLVYVGDHSLEFKDLDTSYERLVQGGNTRDAYKAPLFITGSDYEIDELNKHPVSGFDLMGILANLAGIVEPQLISYPYQVFGDDSLTHRYIIDPTGSLQRYEELPAEGIDVNDLPRYGVKKPH